MGLIVTGDIRLENEGSSAGRFDGDVNVDGTVNALNVKVDGNVFAFGTIEAASNLKTPQLDVFQVFATGPIVAGPVVVNGALEIKPATGSSVPGNVKVDGNVFAFGTIEAASNLKAPQLDVFQVFATGPVNARDINVTGDIRLANADCAEEFDVESTSAQHLAPGTVVVLGDEGCLRHSSASYDKRVAGVVSGGGGYRPGIILDKRSSNADRIAVALMGKVACNVDASYGSVEVGDLLTTSDTPGHAMKASDSSRAFGAVIGKALRPLREGKALVPILVALQ
jgi:cytoskeletal protein CcmA (bactofilin family)